ncbi:hypothetical protein COOONC_17365 [Cooperia oncophora]
MPAFLAKIIPEDISMIRQTPSKQAEWSPPSKRWKRTSNSWRRHVRGKSMPTYKITKQVFALRFGILTYRQSPILSGSEKKMFSLFGNEPVTITRKDQTLKGE